MTRDSSSRSEVVVAKARTGAGGSCWCLFPDKQLWSQTPGTRPFPAKATPPLSDNLLPQVFGSQPLRPPSHHN